jgi:anthranilate phosphoribosyltransferase
MSSTHSKRTDSINSFTDIVRVIGRGATLGRTLTQAEAKQAAQWLLDGQVSDVQLGAFLMMLRLRTESPEEAAGLAEGLRLGLNAPAHIKADIDWPVYAGKRRQLPWFLLASLELAKQGKRVVMHGAVGGDSERLYLEPVICAMGLPIADNWQQAEAALNQHNWVYLRMESFFPQLVGWLDLKQTLGLRSVMHTVARMLNPLNAPLSIRGVFHQEYVDLHAKVALLQGQGRVLVVRGDGGEAEVSADKRIPIIDINNGMINEKVSAPIEGVTRPIAEDLSVDAVAQRLLAVLDGQVEGEDYGKMTVASTLIAL